MGIYIDTVSANVTISDLGITLTHPTTNFNVTSQFSSDQIKSSTDLYNAITSGALIWKVTASGLAQPAANFDPDFIILEDERAGTGYGTAKELATSNSILTLLASDAGKLFFTGTTAGQIVKLPMTTALVLGQEYEIYNLSTVNVTVQYQDGTVFTILLPNSRGVWVLESKNTINGRWFFINQFDDTASGIVNYKLTSSTSFATTSTTDVAITGFTITPLSGNYAVWYNASATSTTNNATYNCTVYRGGSAIADTKRSFVGQTSSFSAIQSSMGTVIFDGTQVCDIRVSASAGTLTVADRTLILIRLGNS